MTTPAALREQIALLTTVRDASRNGGGVRSIDFGKASGDAFIAALTAAIEALQLRTAASEGGAEPAFWVMPHLVSFCKQISAVQKEHCVVVATERTETHTLPLYTHPPEVARDAGRLDWLRNSKNCSLSISHNDHHNMYLSVADTLNDSQGYYDDVPEDERAKMIETDTIWTVHVYPNTPVGFNVYHAATLDAAIDAAISGAAGVGSS